jgi:hypothetical protein
MMKEAMAAYNQAVRRDPQSASGSTTSGGTRTGA